MTLYLVPTPIGNLEDITLRAIRFLKEADLVLAEDTRTTGFLLKHLELHKPMQSYHAFNEHQTVQKVVERIQKGEKVVLVSDAGTPGISDPGYLLVREALKQGIEVHCLPGPTAFVPALVASGIPTDRFVFEGFLPPKKGRQTRLLQLAEEERTIILYESPHRLIKTLEQLQTFFGSDRQAAVVRELTKVFEEHVRGSLSEILATFANRTIKGEIVIIVAGKSS